jgi:hypothetical protein
LKISGLRLGRESDDPSPDAPVSKRYANHRTDRREVLELLRQPIAERAVQPPDRYVDDYVDCGGGGDL